MTIGGPWNSTDGGDPSVDDSSLIQTAIRFVLFAISYSVAETIMLLVLY